MPDQLASWLSVVVAAPGAVVAILQLCKIVIPRRHRREARLVQLKLGPIAWTRIDITDDRQL